MLHDSTNSKVNLGWTTTAHYTECIFAQKAAVGRFLEEQNTLRL